MSEFDPTKCALHEVAIEEIRKDVKDMKNKLFGNGQKGLTYIVERNSVYIMFNNILSVAILGAIVSLLFKVFGA